MTKKGYKQSPEHIRKTYSKETKSSLKIHSKEAHEKILESLKKYYSEHPGHISKTLEDAFLK